MKILTVVGARPQFIKAAVVSRQFQKTSGFSEGIIHTGQHFDANMSDVFFTELEIPKPKFNLEINGSTHGAMTGKMLEAIEQILIAEKPDYVLVYGDTNSTLAGALAAAKLHIPVAHVEAGLRSFNKKMPEEINRILTDNVSSKLFVPTELGRQNLLNEGFKDSQISVVGDVMYDAALYFGQKADQTSQILNDLGLKPKHFFLTTCHRAENTDVPERLQAIMEGLMEVAEKMPVVLPLHPRTKKFLSTCSWFTGRNHKLKLIDPIGYVDMVALEKNAAVIATDSGGVQKEAFFYHVPCVTLRDETEWVELVQSGWNRLVSPTSAKVVSSNIMEAIGTEGKSINPYGNGNAGELIVKELIG